MDGETEATRPEARGWDECVFRLRAVEKAKGGPGHELKPQLLLSYALVVVTSGHVRLQLDDRQFELDAGEAHVLVPEQTWGAVLRGDGAELCVMRFDVYGYLDGSGSDVSGQRGGFGQREDAGLRRLRDAELFPPGAGELPRHVREWLVARCGDLWQKWRGADPLERFRCQIEFQDMLYAIRKYGQPAATRTAGLELAKQYIDAHFREPLTLERLAQVAELSPKYFVELFKKQYGKSAMEYVTERRLQEAKRLMARSGARLRDIANRVGYADEFYFSRVFKKKIGVSPTVYMKRRRRKLVVCRPELIGQLLALDLLPYAAPLHPKWMETYYRDYRHEIPVHLSAYRYDRDWRRNLAQIRDLAADLILAPDDLPETERKQLEQIAPVLYSRHPSADWREALLELAEALGETWQARKWLDEYEQKAAEVRNRLPASYRQQTFAGLRMVDDRLYLYSNRGMAGVLYRDLGLAPPPRLGKEIYDEPVTPDELAALGADHLLLLVRQDSRTLDEWQKLQRHSAWRNLEAVRQQRLHLLSSDPWREYSAHAHWRMLEQARQLFSGDRP